MKTSVPGYGRLAAAGPVTNRTAASQAAPQVVSITICDVFDRAPQVVSITICDVFDRAPHGSFAATKFAGTRTFCPAGNIGNTLIRGHR